MGALEILFVIIIIYHWQNFVVKLSVGCRTTSIADETENVYYIYTYVEHWDVG